MITKESTKLEKSKVNLVTHEKLASIRWKKVHSNYRQRKTINKVKYRRLFEK